MGSEWMLGQAGVGCGSDINYIYSYYGYTELRAILTKTIVFYSLFDGEQETPYYFVEAYSGHVARSYAAHISGGWDGTDHIYI